jgi:toxin-antitoxin system PIN domain toxin
VILLDANLLIYAIHVESPRHDIARAWLEETLSTSTSVGLAWVALLAFLRVTTRPGIFERPLTPEQACGYIDEWLDQPFVSIAQPTAQHWPVLRNLVAATGTGGNLTSDAHLAALAIQHRATVASADHDFGRFPGVEHFDPLA